MRRRQLPGEPPPPSKTELKRQAHAVQDLADRLIGAPAALVAGLALPEELAHALALARRITSHGAKLRQRLYLGKLLRRVDPEPIRAALAADAQAARREAARQRRAERWRDALIARGREAVAEFAREFALEDREALARLAAAAAAERAAARATARQRELFRFIRRFL